MPKYFQYKVCGYFLYFTSSCTIEAMHVHASDSKLTESGSAKFFIKSNGDTIVSRKGVLNDREISRIQAFIKENYMTMFQLWSLWSKNGFYGNWCLRRKCLKPAIKKPPCSQRRCWKIILALQAGCKIGLEFTVLLSIDRAFLNHQDNFLNRMGHAYLIGFVQGINNARAMSIYANHVRFVQKPQKQGELHD